MNGPRLIDVVFEAVGVPEVAFGALPALAANGVLILTGVPAERGPVSADLSRWMREIVLKNQVIFGTVNASRSNYEDAIRRLEQFWCSFRERFCHCSTGLQLIRPRTCSRAAAASKMWLL